MRFGSAIVLAILVLAPTAARAQLAPPSAPLPAPPPAGEKSVDVALGLSVGVTLVGVGGAIAVGSNIDDSDGPFVVGLGAAVLGPSTGHWYAHDLALIGVGARVGGIALLIKGIDQKFDDEDSHQDTSDSADQLLAAGIALFIGGTIYDVVTATSAVHRYNRSRRSSMSVAPMVGPDRTGVVLAGEF